MQAGRASIRHHVAGEQREGLASQRYEQQNEFKCRAYAAHALYLLNFIFVLLIKRFY